MKKEYKVWTDSLHPFVCESYSLRKVLLRCGSDNVYVRRVGAVKTDGDNDVHVIHKESRGNWIIVGRPMFGDRGCVVSVSAFADDAITAYERGLQDLYARFHETVEILGVRRK